MSPWKTKKMRFTERDFEFLVETRSPEVSDKWKLKQILREDADFRNAFISDEQIFRRLMHDDHILLKISPTLYLLFLYQKSLRAIA